MNCFALLGHTKCATTFIWSVLNSCIDVHCIFYSDLYSKNKTDLKREVQSCDKTVYIYDPLAIQNPDTIELIKFITDNNVVPIVVYRNPVDAVVSFCTEAFHGLSKSDSINVGINRDIKLNYLTKNELKNSLITGTANDIIIDRFNYPMTATAIRTHFSNSMMYELLFDDLVANRNIFMADLFNYMGLKFNNDLVPKTKRNESYMPKNYYIYNLVNFLFYRLTGMDSSLLRTAYRRNQMRKDSISYLLMKWNQLKKYDLFSTEEYRDIMCNYYPMIREFEELTGLSVWERWQAQGLKAG